MMVDHLLTYTLPAAYSLLPAAMRSDSATAFITAIGLQESGFTHRKQISGPAHSWFMFERIGVRDVLEHPRTTAAAEALIDALCYSLPKATVARQALIVYEAIMHNDTLACGFARLNLWKLLKPLPGPADVDEAFGQYLRLWRPGAFTRGTDEQKIALRARFGHSYAEAWMRVTASLGGTTS